MCVRVCVFRKEVLTLVDWYCFFISKVKMGRFNSMSIESAHRLAVLWPVGRKTYHPPPPDN